MKASILLLAVVICSLSLSSCKKDKNSELKKFNPELALESFKNEGFESLKVIINDEYEKRNPDGGLKNQLVAPKIGIAIPTNWDLEGPGELNRIVFVWFMIDNNYLVDKGMIVLYFDQNNQFVKNEFFMGWYNEYCTEVTFTSNIGEGSIRMIFGFNVSPEDNYLSFEEWTSNNSTRYLPQINFDFSWEVYSEVSFGGMKVFNPALDPVVDMIMLFEITNNNDFIKFVIPVNGITIDYRIILQIYDLENNMADQAVLLFPQSGIDPEYLMIPLTFSPSRVKYCIEILYNGKWSQVDCQAKQCQAIDPNAPTRIYLLI